MYEVLGEEGAEVEVLGETRQVGDQVELTADEADALVQEGKLKAV